jgi:hypothetical protein
LLGVWWKHDTNVTGFVSLANTSSQAIAAAINVTDAKGTVLGTHSVKVSPNGTKIVSLPELQQTVTTEGGLQVAYTGPAGALDINGGIEDQSIGYSANLRFAPPASGKVSSSTVAAVGIMAGVADPMMLFPVGTTFTPYTMLRNVSETAISVNPTLWWMQGGTSHSYALASLTITAGQVHRLDLTSALSVAGLASFTGNMTLEFNILGPQGTLLVQAGSVDQTGTYVFEVMPRVIKESASKSIGYWSTANGDDTMVSIWNPADEAQNFVFRLVFSGGNYLLPVHLGPRATQTFNISELIQTQVPDSVGNVIPASIHEGSAVLGGVQGDVQHVLVALDVGIYNVRKATCGSSCVYCDGYTSFGPMSPGSATFAVQKTQQYQFLGTYSSGGHYNVAGPWSSSNTRVATIGSSTGVATGVSPGTANFVTSFDEPIYEGNVCAGSNFTCPNASGTPQGGGNVFEVTNVAPSPLVIGTNGPMGIGGSGFNSLVSPVTVNVGGGVTVSNPSVSDDSLINASYNVPTGTSAGTQSLVVCGAGTDGGQGPCSDPFSVTISATAPVPTSATLLLPVSHQTYSNQTWTSCDGLQSANNQYGYMDCPQYQVKDQNGKPLYQNLTISETVSVIDQNYVSKQNNGNNATNPTGVFQDMLALLGTTAPPSNACSILKQTFVASGNSSAIRVNCVQYSSTMVSITDVTSNPSSCSKPTYHC